MNPSKRSSLFLLELMIAILFFCLCSAVCVRLFVQSHVISQDTQNLSMAMTKATSFAEIYRNDDDYFTTLSEQFPNGIIDKEMNSFTLFCDDNWIDCTKSNAVYSVSLSVKELSKTMSQADFEAVALADEKTIYHFATKKYIGGVDYE